MTAVWEEALWTSLQAVATIVFIAGIGLVLGRTGHLEKPARGALAGVVMRVGTPTLLFTRLLNCPQCRVGLKPGQDCAPCTNAMDYVREAWLVLLLPFIFTGIGLLLGRLVADVTRCPDAFRSVCMLAVAIPNYLGIPIVVLDNLGSELQRLGVVSGDPVPFHAVMNLTAEACLFTVSAYMLDMSKTKPQEQPKDQALPDSEQNTAAQPLCDQAHARDLAQEDLETSPQEEATVQEELEAHEKVQAWLADSWAFCREIASLVFGLPPVWGLIASLAIVLMNPFIPLHSLMVDQTQMDSAPLTFAFKGLMMTATLVVPLNLIVLGANLSKGVDFSTTPLATCLGIAFGKLVMMPILMILAVYVLARTIPPQRAEVWFIVLLEACPPTGNMVSTMVELSGKDSRSLSTAMMVQYYFAPLTMTLWLTTYAILLQTDWYIPATI